MERCTWKGRKTRLCVLRKTQTRVTTVPDCWVLVLSPGTISFLSCMRLMRWPVAPCQPPPYPSPNIYIYSHTHTYIHILCGCVCIYTYIMCIYVKTYYTYMSFYSLGLSSLLTWTKSEFCCQNTENQNLKMQKEQPLGLIPTSIMFYLAPQLS